MTPMMKDQVFINGVDDRDGMVLFRHLGDHVPESWTRGFHWQVEYHAPQDRGFPIGLAWVIAPPLGGSWPKGTYPRPCITFVLVVDEERRKGIGTKLVQAIRERWPNAMFTDAISEADEALERNIYASEQFQ